MSDKRQYQGKTAFPFVLPLLISLGGIVMRAPFFHLLSLVVLVILLIELIPRGRQRRPRASAPGVFAPLSHGDTHYRDFNPKGKNLVVCVHGFNSAAWVYDRLAEALAADGCRVITFDLYGRGHSDAPDANNDANLFVNQLAELLDYVYHPEKRDEPKKGLPDVSGVPPFTLIGWSMGGVVVSNFCLAYPDLVKNLVLIAPAGLPVRKPPITKLLQLPLIRNLLVYLGPPTMLKNMDRDWSAISAPNDRSMYQSLRNAFIDTCEEHPGHLRSLMSTLVHFPLETSTETFQKLGKHDRHILIIWGDQDTLCPYVHAATLQKYLTKAELVTLQQGTHQCVLQRPKEIEKAVMDLIKKH